MVAYILFGIYKMLQDPANTCEELCKVCVSLFDIDTYYNSGQDILEFMDYFIMYLQGSVYGLLYLCF